MESREPQHTAVITERAIPPERRILLLNASPHAEGHTSSLLLASSESLPPSLNVSSCSLAGLEILPCRDCAWRCEDSGRCHLDDDFEYLADLWCKADGVILGSPVHTFGPPSPLHSFFERLRMLRRGDEPSPPKPIGIIVQGGAAYSGAEVTAQSLMALALSVGCFPVSGDMPGSSQGVIGQVPNNRQPEPGLKAAAGRLGLRLAEMVEIVSAGRESLAKGTAQAGNIHLLGAIVGDIIKPQSQALLNAATRGRPDRPGAKVEIDTFYLDERSVAPCRACTQYCSTDLECTYHDGMQDFRSRWLEADAVIWIAGADFGGGSPSLRATLDRMNQVRFETHFALRQAHMPRYLKATGILTLGTDPSALGATAQFLRHCALLYQNVLVAPPPNRPHADGCLCLDAKGELPAGASEMAHGLGERLIDLAIVLRAGLACRAAELPDEYFPSNSRFGRLGRASTPAEGVP